MNTDQQKIEQLINEIEERIILTRRDIRGLQTQLAHALLKQYTDQANNAAQLKEAIANAQNALSDLEAIKPVLPDYLAQLQAERKQESQKLFQGRLAQSQQNYAAKLETFKSSLRSLAFDGSGGQKLMEAARELYALATAARQTGQLREYFRDLGKKGGPYTALGRF